MNIALRNIFIILIIIPLLVSAQTISGRLINQNGSGLAGLELKLHISPDFYVTNSLYDGSFTFNNVTNVSKEILPVGYFVSDNYPNPFNPKTRINITLPKSVQVKVSVYNILGQKVREEYEKIFGAGNNYLDLELNGLPNGLYIAQITLDGKYVITKKMILLYGSQHYATYLGAVNLDQSKLLDLQSTMDTKIDSLVVSGGSIGKKVFSNLPIMKGPFINIGNLEIYSGITCQSIVTYLERIYNVVKIGEQCWLKENLNVGSMIHGSQNQTYNGVIEKFCYNNDSDNCNLYGGLYQWNEAMQYNKLPDTRGICPEGYRLPTLEDLRNLEKSVTGANALKKLNEGSGDGVGTNTSGFSALLSGALYGYNKTFSNSNSFTYFWSSDEYFTTSASSLNLDYHSNAINFLNYPKDYGFSVRCLSTAEQIVPSIPTLSSPTNNMKGIAISPKLDWSESLSATSYNIEVSDNSDFSNIVFTQDGFSASNIQVTDLAVNTTYYWRVRASNSLGTSAWSNTWAFTTVEANMGDPCPGVPNISYGGQIYHTVLIGSQCWLKENLNIGSKISSEEECTDNGIIEKYCYNNDDINCDTYGGLYQWAEAMKHSTPHAAQGICPQGWHIPSLDEFYTLKASVNYDGNLLKSENQGVGDGAGNGFSGFNALLSGNRNYEGIFNSISNGGYFWSSTEGSLTEANGLALYSFNNDIFLYYSSKKYGVSVRCLKN